VTIYTLSIKSPYSYLNIFSIMLPITSSYRLTVVRFYRHLYTKYIWITYNIIYKGSLYFGIPGVLLCLWHNSTSIPNRVASQPCQHSSVAFSSTTSTVGNAEWGQQPDKSPCAFLQKGTGD